MIAMLTVYPACPARWLLPHTVCRYAHWFSCTGAGDWVLFGGTTGLQLRAMRGLFTVTDVVLNSQRSRTFPASSTTA